MLLLLQFCTAVLIRRRQLEVIWHCLFVLVCTTVVTFCANVAIFAIFLISIVFSACLLSPPHFKTSSSQSSLSLLQQGLRTFKRIQFFTIKLYSINQQISTNKCFTNNILSILIATVSNNDVSRLSLTTTLLSALCIQFMIPLMIYICVQDMIQLFIPSPSLRFLMAVMANNVPLNHFIQGSLIHVYKSQ